MIAIHVGRVFLTDPQDVYAPSQNVGGGEEFESSVSFDSHFLRKRISVG